MAYGIDPASWPRERRPKPLAMEAEFERAQAPYTRT
jgi:hypothetical protein